MGIRYTVAVRVIPEICTVRKIIKDIRIRVVIYIFQPGELVHVCHIAYTQLQGKVLRNGESTPQAHKCTAACKVLHIGEEQLGAEIAKIASSIQTHPSD